MVVAKSAQKQYKRFPKTEQSKIKKKLTSLSENPGQGKKLGGDLRGRRVIRAWPYRIIYMFNKEKNMIEVSDILHRQGAYK